MSEINANIVKVENILSLKKGDLLDIRLFHGGLKAKVTEVSSEHKQ